MNSKVSVIIPAYNSERTIQKCLNSVLNQSYSNYEVIIVNDGSIDDTQKIVNEVIKDDKRFFLINKKNDGSSEARKTGLKNISEDSDYFCFLDSDDYFDKDFLLNMLQAANDNNAEIVQCRYKKFIGNLKFNSFERSCLKELNNLNNKEFMETLYISYFGITNFPVNLCTKLYHNKFKDKMINQETIVKFMGDDISVNIKIMPYCKKLIIIPKDLYYYRIGGNTSKFMPDFMNDCYAVYKLKQEMIEKYKLSNEYKLYSTIELVNEFHTWMLMCYRFKNRQDLINEYNKWVHNKRFMSDLLAVNDKWNDDFYSLIINLDFDNVYKLIKKEIIKSYPRRMIKRLLAYVVNIID